MFPKYYPVFFLFGIMQLFSCSSKLHLQKIDPVFETPSGSQPDYSFSKNWAALPELSDNADRVPKHSKEKDLQSVAQADVFFIHPTTYTRTTDHSKDWNANIDDPEINKRTDKTTILYQASTFNSSARVFAPRYRQANISSYFTNQASVANEAFDLAYTDVKSAFEYYLKNYNQGRPIIIASHSQGTTHAIRLLKEYFDGKELSKQLVAAYLVGMPVYDSVFTKLKPCEDSTETGCYTSWRTYARDFYPEGYVQPLHPAICTNPLSWKTDTINIPRELNPGTILKNFDRIVEKVCDAQVDIKDGVLRISRPHFTGSRLYNLKNYHIADFNLFYMSIRRNAQKRIDEFLKHPRN